MGMLLDCSDLLISDLAANVVVWVSLGGSAGTVPTTEVCDYVSEAIVAGCGNTDVGATVSKQPGARHTATIRAVVSPSGWFESFMKVPLRQRPRYLGERYKS